MHSFPSVLDCGYDRPVRVLPLLRPLLCWIVRWNSKLWKPSSPPSGSLVRAFYHSNSTETRVPSSWYSLAL